jgi:hypothetical protein
MRGNKSVRVAAIILAVAFALWVGWSFLVPGISRLVGFFLIDVAKEAPGGKVSIVGPEGITGAVFSGEERVALSIEHTDFETLKVYLGDNKLLYSSQLNRTQHEFLINTTMYPDELCGYRLNIVLEKADGTQLVETTKWFSILNTQRPVRWDEFKHEQSTNLSAITWPYEGRIELYTPGGGKLTLPKHTVLSGIDLDGAVEVSHGRVHVNRSGFLCWKLRTGSFRMEFEDIHVNTPRILKDKEVCGQGCRVVAYEDGRLVVEFSAPGEYEVTEGLTASLDVYTPALGEQRHIVNQSIRFFADYLDLDGQPIRGRCVFKVPEFGTEAEMEYSKGQYTIEKGFPAAGTFSYIVCCDDPGVPTNQHSISGAFIVQ